MFTTISSALSFIGKGLTVAICSLGFSFSACKTPAPIIPLQPISQVEKAPQVDPLGAYDAGADFRSSLAFEISVSATSMTLNSTSTPSGEALVMGHTYGFKLGGREYVKGTLSAGKQITSMTRGISLINGTTTGGVAEPWGRGTAVELTDAPLILEHTNKINGTQNFDNVLTYDSAYSIASSSNQIPSASYIYNNYVNTSENQTNIAGDKTFNGNTTLASITPAFLMTVLLLLLYRTAGLLMYLSREQ